MGRPAGGPALVDANDTRPLVPVRRAGLALGLAGLALSIGGGAIAFLVVRLRAEEAPPAVEARAEPDAGPEAAAPAVAARPAGPTRPVFETDLGRVAEGLDRADPTVAALLAKYVQLLGRRQRGEAIEPSAHADEVDGLLAALAPGEARDRLGACFSGLLAAGESKGGAR